jgi:hypothetical protein
MVAPQNIKTRRNYMYSPFDLGELLLKSLIWKVKKPGVCSHFFEICMIFKKISIGKRAFIDLCYIW